MALWTPEEISPHVWFDPSDESTIVHDGSVVTSITDKGASGAVLTATTTAPGYEPNHYNGLTALDFTLASSKALVGTWDATVLNTGVYRVYVAVKAQDVQWSTGYESVVQWDTTALDGVLWYYANPNVMEAYEQSAGTANASYPSTDTSNRQFYFDRNGSAREFFADDASAGTDSVAFGNRTASEALRIGAHTFSSNKYCFRGWIREVVITDGTEDPNYMTGYLAWKWGSVDRLDASHPFKDAAPEVADPITIITQPVDTTVTEPDGAVFTVEAELTSEPTDELWGDVYTLNQFIGDAVSPVGYYSGTPPVVSGTAAWTASGGKFGPGIEYLNSGSFSHLYYYDAPDISGDASFEFFYDPTSLATSSPTAFDALLHIEAGADGLVLFLFSDGKVYLRKNTTELVTATAHGMSTSTQHFIQVRKVSNTYNVYIDGVLVAADNASGLSFSAPTGGNGFSVGAFVDGTHSPHGVISELRVTTADRGVAPVPTAPFPTQGPAAEPTYQWEEKLGGPLWTPADMTTHLWLDASDAATITDTGGLVDLWTDKSGNGHDVVGTSTTRPDYNAANSSIDFTGNEVLTGTITGAEVSGDITVVGCWRSTGVDGVLSYEAAIQWMTGDLLGVMWRYAKSANQQIQTYFNGASVSAPSNSYLNGDFTRKVASFTLRGTDSEFRFNGTSLATSTSTPVSTASDQNLRIGDPTFSGNNTHAITGEYFEFIIADGTADVEQLEGYLAWKWGFESGLPNEHPYKSLAPGAPAFTPMDGETANTLTIDPTSVVLDDGRRFRCAVSDQGPLWTPAEITTALWLDAADASTITEVTGVSEWRDKSGNARHGTQATGGAQPIYEPANELVRFQGGNYYLEFDDFLAGQAEVTWVAVLSGATQSNNGLWGPSNEANHGFEVLHSNGAGHPTTVRALAGSRKTSDNIWPRDGGVTYGVASFDYASGNVQGYGNGTAQTMEDTSYGGALDAVTGNGKYAMGRYAASALYASFYVKEWVILPAASVENRQLLEGYMAWKHGLEADLDASHPYKDGAPTV